ncbi:hypothetical protein [Novosphingobium kaempferiae]|uniref:hypothetical protein n=1 Tax=Novosphingobium kaempferiae TaxID=2896849 RepID=UPI001E527DAA|nr:hypothetical protein [Novosphingobium kaempferiae]
MSATNPTLEELRLLHALSNVCDQYMPGGWEYVNYEGFGAGRYGVEMLAEYGLLLHDPSFGGEWTTRGIIIREQHAIDSGNYEKIKQEYLLDKGVPLRRITGRDNTDYARNSESRCFIADHQNFEKMRVTLDRQGRFGRIIVAIGLTVLLMQCFRSGWL